VCVCVRACVCVCVCVCVCARARAPWASGAHQIKNSTADEIEVMWEEKCAASPDFEVEGGLSLRKFECRVHTALMGGSEQLWTGQLFAMLSLGGHAIAPPIVVDWYDVPPLHHPSQSPSSLRLTGWLVVVGGTPSSDVPLQGARAIPQEKDRAFTRPDMCIGLRAADVGGTWIRLGAGQAVLPPDILEFKSARVGPEEDW
jgi:hypothetical protein